MNQYNQYPQNAQNNQNMRQNTPQNIQNPQQNGAPNDQKPLPSVELSLKFMSWSVKELVTALQVQQKMLDQKLSEITMQLREVNANISNKATPF